MDWTQILTTVLSGVFGLTTLVGAILYPKAARREKEAEVKLKEIETKDKDAERLDKRFDALHEDIDTLNKQLTAAYKDKARSEEIISDKTKRIREKDDEIAELNRLLHEREKYIGRLKLFIQWLATWFCRREHGRPADKGNNGVAKCNRRFPEQVAPIPFSDYPDKDLVEELGTIVTEKACDIEVCAERFNININAEEK